MQIYQIIFLWALIATIVLNVTLKEEIQEKRNQEAEKHAQEKQDAFEAKTLMLHDWVHDYCATPNRTRETETFITHAKSQMRDNALLYYKSSIDKNIVTCVFVALVSENESIYVSHHFFQNEIEIRLDNVREESNLRLWFNIPVEKQGPGPVLTRNMVIPYSEDMHDILDVYFQFHTMMDECLEFQKSYSEVGWWTRLFGGKNNPCKYFDLIYIKPSRYDMIF